MHRHRIKNTKWKALNEICGALFSVIFLSALLFLKIFQVGIQMHINNKEKKIKGKTPSIHGHP